MLPKELLWKLAQLYQLLPISLSMVPPVVYLMPQCTLLVGRCVTDMAAKCWPAEWAMVEWCQLDQVDSLALCMSHGPGSNTLGFKSMISNSFLTCWIIQCTARRREQWPKKQNADGYKYMHPLPPTTVVMVSDGCASATSMCTVQPCTSNQRRLAAVINPCVHCTGINPRSTLAEPCSHAALCIACHTPQVFLRSPRSLCSTHARE